MSKSEYKRLCVQDPIGMANKLHELEQQLIKLEVVLLTENAELKARIKAMEEQEPVAWKHGEYLYYNNSHDMNFIKAESTPLYAAPTTTMFDKER